MPERPGPLVPQEVHRQTSVNVKVTYEPTPWKDLLTRSRAVSIKGGRRVVIRTVVLQQWNGEWGWERSVAFFFELLDGLPFFGLKRAQFLKQTLPRGWFEADFNVNWLWCGSRYDLSFVDGLLVGVESVPTATERRFTQEDLVGKAAGSRVWVSEVEMCRTQCSPTYLWSIDAIDEAVGTRSDWCWCIFRENPDDFAPSWAWFHGFIVFRELMVSWVFGFNVVQCFSGKIRLLKAVLEFPKKGRVLDGIVCSSFVTRGHAQGTYSPHTYKQTPSDLLHHLCIDERSPARNLTTKPLRGQISLPPEHHSIYIAASSWSLSHRHAPPQEDGMEVVPYFVEG
ncbi:hypothetical protein B0H11DRAFT_1938184 [Mycena galericulata]|nr:hypothetical protein B0H11DRAFT_1938184 [Mycena galericulata]